MPHAAEPRADRLIVMIDGVHILTPGILALATETFAFYESPFVATTAFHLGPKRQYFSMLEGYDQNVKDRLLERAG